jgi:hypothetical protein
LLYHSLSDPSKHAQFAEEGLGSIVEMYEWYLHYTYALIYIKTYLAKFNHSNKSNATAKLFDTIVSEWVIPHSLLPVLAPIFDFHFSAGNNYIQLVNIPEYHDV